MVTVGIVSVGWGVGFGTWTAPRTNGASSRRLSRSRPAVAGAGVKSQSPCAGSGSEETKDSSEPSSSSVDQASTSLAAQGIAAWPLIVRTFALHAAHVAARVFAQPLQPAAERLQARAAASEAVQRACSSLACNDLQSLRELCNALALSECVYRVVDRAPSEAVRSISALKSAFPPGLGTLTAAQFALPNVQHRFCIAESDTEFYVAFMGTKLPRDYVTNAAVWEEQVRLDASLLSSDDAEMQVSDSSSSSSSSRSVQQGQAPAAHRGFLSRARGIPVDQIFEEAQRRGKKLVLCGHSLGGAVAQLCALQLLQRLPPTRHDAVSCVTFAAPALCNRSLAEMATDMGWSARIRNFLVPEDPIPHLLTMRRSNGDGSNVSSASSGGPSAAAKVLQSDDSAAPEGSAPPHVQLARAASNILIRSVSSSIISRSDRNAAGGDPAAASPSGEKDLMSAAVSARSAASEESAPSSDTSPPATARADVKLSPLPPSTAISPEPRRRRSALGVVATAGSKSFRMATKTALGAARMAASVPMSAAPRYLPLGRQMYILSDGVQEGPKDGSVPTFPRKSKNEQGNDAEVARGTMLADMDPVHSAPRSSIARSLTWPWGMSLRSVPTEEETMDPCSSGSISIDGGDDDDVDVAAAAALQSGGLIPDRLPRRTLFPSHRMLTYRCRLMSLANDALQGTNFRRWSPLALLDALPAGGDVTCTELLAPAMFPLKAEASVIGNLSGSQQQPNGTPFPPAPLDTAPRAPATALARRWTWPLRRIARKTRPAEDAAPVEMLLRVEGRGLSNVRSAWVSGAHSDASGRATPATVEIVSRPQPPLPSAVVRPTVSPLVAPVAAFVSWLALAAGWVTLLRQLQPAGRGDFLVAKVRLPAGSVRRAQAAASDPLMAAVGDAPKFMMHLASDFAVQSVPLEIRSAPGNRGSRLGGRWMFWDRNRVERGSWKDTGDFLRYARPRWMVARAANGQRLS